MVVTSLKFPLHTLNLIISFIHSSSVCHYFTTSSLCTLYGIIFFFFVNCHLQHVVACVPIHSAVCSNSLLRLLPPYQFVVLHTTAKIYNLCFTNHELFSLRFIISNSHDFFFRYSVLATFVISIYMYMYFFFVVLQYFLNFCKSLSLPTTVQ